MTVALFGLGVLGDVREHLLFFRVLSDVRDVLDVMKANKNLRGTTEQALNKNWNIEIFLDEL